MNIDLGIRFITSEHKCLCFTHAVQEAIKGVEVEVEIDEFDVSGNDLRQTWCQICEDLEAQDLL